MDEEALIAYFYLFVWSQQPEEQKASQCYVERATWDSKTSGINDLGQIVGTNVVWSAQSDTLTPHAVLWNPVFGGYRIQDLGPWQSLPHQQPGRNRGRECRARRSLEAKPLGL